MESKCVSDTRTDEQNIGPNTDRFKVMVYTLVLNHTHLRFLPLAVLSFLLSTPRDASFFSLSIPISHIIFTPPPLLISPCMCVDSAICLLYVSHTHTRMHMHTHPPTSVHLIVSICLSVTPLSNLPSA